jgi:predicted esterase
MGAGRILDFVLQHPEQQPQLLVSLSGAGLSPSSTLHPLSSIPHCPVLLVHGGQDEIFPVADVKRLASILQDEGSPTQLKIIPGAPHVMGLDRSLIFGQLAGGVCWG